MRATEKIALLKKISETLNEKYNETEIIIFLNHFNIKAERSPDRYGYDDFIEAFGNYKGYLTVLLSGESVEKIIQVAEELEISTINLTTTPPRNWEETEEIKAFISHSSKNKNLATSLKKALKPFNIDCFVAHEDTVPSLEWQTEIDKALKTMDFFISLHTEDFDESIWCQQEIGYACSRNVKVIPIKFSSDPIGFIGKIQALIRRDKQKATDMAPEIINLLKDDERTKYLFEEEIVEEEFLEDEIPF